MSLVCWLPLDGDLHNKGCSNLEFIYSGTNIVSNDNGKIGKCYYRTTKAADGIISNKPIYLGINQSMFCWIKYDSFHTTASLTGVLSQHRPSTYTGMGITLRCVSTTEAYVSVNTGTGSERTYKTYYGKTKLEPNNWYHIGYTYDGATIKIYVNGILDKEQSFTGMSCPEDYILIGNWSFKNASGTGINNYCAPGYINDVRIYDHCLSPMEVYSISKAKILHYQFDNDISDCAGYGHDGTISAYTTSADTPRYLLSTVLTGSQSGSTPYLFDSTALIPEFTWAGWIYRDYTDATARYLYQGIVDIYLHTNFNARMRWNHGESDGTYSGNAWGTVQKIPYQQWTHLAWTFKDGYLKIYINGEYKNYNDRTSTGQYIKGYRNNLLANNWIGKISDMRIYATALSDDDIKFLYECNGAVDNGNSVWSYNFYETSSNTKTDVITYSTTDLNLNTTATLSSSPYDKYSNAITINRNASYYTISLSSRIKTQSGSGSCNIYIVYYDSSGSELSLTQIASSSLTTTARTVAINRVIVIKDMPAEATTFKIRLMGSRPINYTAFSGSIVESITNYCVDNKGNFYSNIITVDSSLANSYIGADRNLHAINLIEL